MNISLKKGEDIVERALNYSSNSEKGLIWKFERNLSFFFLMKAFLIFNFYLTFSIKSWSSAYSFRNFFSRAVFAILQIFELSNTIFLTNISNISSYFFKLKNSIGIIFSPYIYWRYSFMRSIKKFISFTTHSWINFISSPSS